MSMTESEARSRLSYLKSKAENALSNTNSNCEWAKEDVKGTIMALDMAIAALEEVQQLHAIGTVSEFRENKNFLEFLYNAINPNEMEQCLAMYHASEEKGE